MACLGNDTWQGTNGPASWSTLVASLRACSADLVLLQSLAGHERGLACALHLAGFHLVRLNPRQAILMGGSTEPPDERLDALGLCRLAERMARDPDRHRHVRPLPKADVEQLSLLMNRRSELTQMHRREAERLSAAHGRIARNIGSVMVVLKKHIAEVDREIQRRLDDHFDGPCRWFDRLTRERRAGP